MNVFKNKYGELRGGWGVALAMAVFFAVEMTAQVVVGIFIGIYLTATGAGVSVETAQALTQSPLVQLFTVLFSIAGTLLFLRVAYKRTPVKIGLTSPRAPRALTDFLLGCGVGIAAISAAVGFLLLTGQGTIVAVSPRTLANPQLWLWLVLFVGVAFNEELLARGLLMTVLKPNRSKLPILLVSAAVFALMHVFNPSYTWLAALNIFLIGLVFGMMFLRTGQLWLPIGFHLTWNFFQGNVWGVEVSGLETPSVVSTAFTGPAWLTGGLFGAEGGVAVTGISLLLLALLCFAWPQRKDAPWRLDSDLPFVRAGKELVEPQPEPALPEPQEEE